MRVPFDSYNSCLSSSRTVSVQCYCLKGSKNAFSDNASLAPTSFLGLKEQSCGGQLRQRRAFCETLGGLGLFRAVLTFPHKLL